MEPNRSVTNPRSASDEARGDQEPHITRRNFLRGVAAVGVVAGAVGLSDLLPTGTARAAQIEPPPDPGGPASRGAATTSANAADIGPATDAARAEQALDVRVAAVRYERGQTLPAHPDNGDEDLYPNKIASYSKALPHNDRGEVDLAAYNAFIRALMTGRFADFEAIPLGGTAELVDPQAALAFSLLGPDSHQLAIPPAPTFASAQQAAETAELYWQALARDVPFSQYDSNPITQQAAEDLSRFSDYRGPKVGGQVTAQSLFRGNLSGDLVGPYISQFLWADIAFGPRPLDQRIRTAAPGVDFLTAYDDWLAVQNGVRPPSTGVADPTLRYIRNGRDLGEWVHRDFPYQAGLDAALTLFGMDARLAQGGNGVLPGSMVLPQMGAPFDQNNPYLRSRTQTGFATFGIPDVLDLVAVVANRALEAAWFQKWLVHRRLRPEAFGGRVHNRVTGRADYPIDEELLQSPVLDSILDRYGTYLLPQAYPEGAPEHPAYPSGHAAFVGACCTVLKAVFDESFVLPNPVVASDDGLSLRPFAGPSLTVGGELNKLASNIATGRAFAGIHYRTCAESGLKLGEAVAIGVLAEKSLTYPQEFPGFALTKFDGSRIVVNASTAAAWGSTSNSTANPNSPDHLPRAGGSPRSPLLSALLGAGAVAASIGLRLRRR